MGKVEGMSREILRHLLADFQKRSLGVEALRQSYQGVTISALRQVCCGKDADSAVDFDLAFDDLDKDGLIGTGPMVPYENDPGSSVVVIGLFSKREYAYLTEKGYKAARN